MHFLSTKLNIENIKELNKGPRFFFRRKKSRVFLLLFRNGNRTSFFLFSIERGTELILFFFLGTGRTLPAPPIGRFQRLFSFKSFVFDFESTTNRPGVKFSERFPRVRRNGRAGFRTIIIRV